MYKLSFCRINLIEKHIAEVIVKGGTEVTAMMVEELFYFITDEMSGEISIIMNRATNYSYQFDASVKLSVSTLVKNVAIIAYNEKSTSMSKYMKTNFNKSEKRIKVFGNRDEALSWIKEVSSTAPH